MNFVLGCLWWLGFWFWAVLGFACGGLVVLYCLDAPGYFALVGWCNIVPASDSGVSVLGWHVRWFCGF